MRKAIHLILLVSLMSLHLFAQSLEEDTLKITGMSIRTHQKPLFQTEATLLTSKELSTYDLILQQQIRRESLYNQSPYYNIKEYEEKIIILINFHYIHTILKKNSDELRLYKGVPFDKDIAMEDIDHFYLYKDAFEIQLKEHEYEYPILLDDIPPQKMKNLYTLLKGLQRSYSFKLKITNQFKRKILNLSIK